ncbi:hypothetical protein QBC38DRAFT_369247 [Podospora fimiseda]|uniref:Uncharacterized protein n=1 Tax=Podospora fimiseda TaxID=252190 RepID=A0AAN7BL16_9PEZI|nr:hypothetical protein QBC38DRAFT_369247 [Podospora fimiseda]
MPKAKSETALKGARPLTPGELDGYWKDSKRKEIIERGLYLVQNHLEVPPHIKGAYEHILEIQDGHDWTQAGTKYICGIIDSLPHRLFDTYIYKRKDLREPDPETSPAYYDIMRRLLLAEHEFYSTHAESVGGNLLKQIQLSSSHRGSFKHHLKHSGVSIDKILHFSRTVCINRYSETWPSLQYQLENRRRFFLLDIARYLVSKHATVEDIARGEYYIPGGANPDAYIEEGFMSINLRTLVFDTTLNSSLIRLMVETGMKPGVIIKTLTFWRDGDDDERQGERPGKWK